MTVLDKARVVEYEERHREAFRALNLTWITRYFVVEDSDRKALDDPEAGILRDGGCILMAEDGDAIVGCVALIREDPDTFELAKMAVDPSAQGRGIGALLGRAAIDRARSLGARRVELLSNRTLLPALSLYRKLGFVEVPLGAVNYVRSDIRMALDLQRRMDFDLAQSVDLLRRTPAVLNALLAGLSEPWPRASEGPDTFSPFDVVGHLIDGEETDWIPRAHIILARGPDPRFEPYDRFRHRARNVGRSLESLLAEFARLRAANLDLLTGWNLSEAELDLPGTHPILGPVTLRQLIAAWVVHDLGHLAQIERVMAKQYRDAVGPWVPFMPILTDHEVPRS